MHSKTRQNSLHALVSLKLSTLHRTSTEKEKVDDKAPRVLGPADTIIHTRVEGPTLQRCGDCEVAGEVDQWPVFSGTEVQGKIGQSHTNIVPTAEKEYRKFYFED